MKKLLVVALLLGGTQLLASSPISQGLAAKVKHTVAATGMVLALFALPVTTASAEVGDWFDVIHKLDYQHLKALLESGKVDVTARDEEGKAALHSYTQHLYTSAQQGEFYDFGHHYKDLDAKLKLVLDYGVNPGLATWRYAEKAANTYVKNERWDGFIISALFHKAIWGIDGDSGFGEPLQEAIYYANRSGDIGLALLLVEQGADVFAPDYNDSCALDICSALEAAAVLVRDKKKFLKTFRTARRWDDEVLGGDVTDEELFRLAIRWGNSVVVEELLNQGVSPDAGISEAMYYQRKYGTTLAVNPDPQHEVLRVLASHDADFNVWLGNNRQGFFTLLDVATEVGSIGAAEILLEHGANPNAVGAFGQTPLHRATSHHRMIGFNLVGMLLAHGALAIKDNYGQTPYFYVMSEYENTYAGANKQILAATAAILLKKMFGTSGRDAKGRTPAYWAELSGSKTMQQLATGEMEIAQLAKRATRQQIALEIE